MGKGDNLAGVGGIGEDFLITGDGGVEHHFADTLAHGTNALPLENRAVSQREKGVKSLRHDRSLLIL